MRTTALTISFDKSKVSDANIQELQQAGYDIEQDGKSEEWRFYSHNVDGLFKRMERDLLTLFPAVYKVDNRAKGGTDHLDMFVEVQDEDQADYMTDEKMYKNVRLGEVKAGEYDLKNCLLMKEIREL